MTEEKVNNVTLVTQSAARKCWVMRNYASFMTRGDRKQ